MLCARKPGVQVVHHAEVVHVIQTAFFGEDAGLGQHLLNVLHAFFGQVHLLLLFVDPVVTAGVVFLGLALELREPAD